MTINTKALSELAEIYYGESPAAIKVANSDIPILGTGGFLGYARRPLFETEAIVVGRKGTLGNPIYTPGKFWAIDTTYAVIAKDGINTKWLYYSLLNYGLDSLNEATGVPSINRERLYSILLTYFDYAEQRKIADILSTLDEAIALSESLVRKCQSIKQGLMSDLLTRGVDENGVIRNEKTHRFQKTPVGERPFEWRIGTIKDLAINLDGNRIPIKQADREKMRGDIPYYGASGVIDWVNGFLFDGEYVLLGEDGENVVSRKLPLAFRVSGRFWVNNHAHIYQPKNGTNINFLTELLESIDYTQYISGSAQPKLTQTILNKIPLPIPSKREQLNIGNILECQDSAIGEETDVLNKLKLLKQGLMQDLLSGQVRVTM